MTQAGRHKKFIVFKPKQVCERLPGQFCHLVLQNALWKDSSGYEGKYPALLDFPHLRSSQEIQLQM